MIEMSGVRHDAIIVGSGPNGLTAAITLAQAGLKVCVLEANAVAGGGARSAELTLPGFIHDVCSAVHPLGVGSPVLRSMPLSTYGLKWIHPPAPLAHPLEDGSAILLDRSVEQTAQGLGVDEKAYRTLMSPLARNWETLAEEFLKPIHFPRHPLRLARFGRNAIRPAEAFARDRFRGQAARTLFAGLAAHAILPLNKPVSAAFGLVLGMLAHGVGWPIPHGGSQSIANALCEYLRELGGDIVTERRVQKMDELPPARAVLFDVTPRQLLRIAGDRFTASYRRSLERYRYGPAVFKMDWALRGPIPWKSSQCLEAATVHIGASLEEIAACERGAWTGTYVSRPFLILAQPSLFDSTRAPAGKHTAWAYFHVPNGSRESYVDEVENQIERYAPGFRQMILARHVFNASTLEASNANLVGGDINGGAQDLSQLFFRPTRRLYRTSAKGIYICSASTPPGGGVHGMCGYYAAKAALADLG